MANFYKDAEEKEPLEIAIGREIYQAALDDRRGFRDDQIGIPNDDDIWLEIFGAIGRAALAALAKERS